MLQHIAAILACTVMVLLVICPGTPAGPTVDHLPNPYGTMEAADHCRSSLGNITYEKYAQICADCFGVFAEAELRDSCRKDCFKSPYFKGCYEILNPPSRTPPKN